MENEKRERLRLNLRKLAFAKDTEDGETRGGTLIDISASGAAIELAAPLEGLDNPFTAGDEVEIEIEGMSPLIARVSRVLDKGIAFNFSPGKVAEDQIIAEIMEIFEKNE